MALGTGVTDRGPSPDLSSLLMRIARGDQDAFSDFYSRTATEVYGFVHGVVVDRQLSEDATRDAYLSVWRDASLFNAGQGSASAWLRTIAQRTAVKFLRSREAPANNAGVETAVATIPTHTSAGLSAVQHEALHCAYLAGLTGAEIARKLALPLSTINANLTDAVRILGLRGKAAGAF